jgi:hypothetical protein
MSIDLNGWPGWPVDYLKWYYGVMGWPLPDWLKPQAPQAPDWQSKDAFSPPDNSVPWAYPDDAHGVDTWDFSGGYGYGGDGDQNPKKKKTKKRGRGQQMSRRARKIKPVRVRPKPGGGNAGKATEAYPTASQLTGGAIPLRELDALSEVGLTPLLAELVNHGTVSLATTLSAWQREQDRITNRTWRRPGGLYRPAGL